MQKKIILVSDDPRPFLLNGQTPVSDDACAEWEDTKTLQAIQQTWEELGYKVELLLLNEQFMTRWQKLSGEDILVHSMTEGWGTPSREAWIPSLCELTGTPWIGSSPSAFSICMDKDLTTLVGNSLGVPTPKGKLVNCYASYDAWCRTSNEAAHFVKPNFEGSGMGVDARSRRPKGQRLPQSELESLLHRYPEGLRVEEELTGIELTTALIGQRPEFLPVAQIKVPNGIYGIEHKQKHEMTEEVLFPKIELSVLHNLEHWCRKLWARLSLEDFSRFDWKLDEAGQPRLIEINPLAGLSPYYSVLPILWKEAGRSYKDMLNTLAEAALTKEKQRRLMYGRVRMSQSFDATI